jgi:uncharacterized protein (TIGR02145 family)
LVYFIGALVENICVWYYLNIHLYQNQLIYIKIPKNNFNKTKFMRKKYLFLMITLALGLLKTNAQTVTDYDGNVYNTVVIGNQTWLKENLKSLHFCDGTSIPDVVAYNNDEANAAVYGRLYTWNATVRDSVATQVQGVCPCGWHVGNNTEWVELITYLGGPNVAGGKMKEAGITHWQAPNGGANNSSGFTALGSGEYDAHQNMTFQLLHQYEVYWTSTQVSTNIAKEKYLGYLDSSCLNYDWYKIMKYSVRCIKNTGSSVSPPLKKPDFKIITPTGDQLKIIYDGFVDLKSVEIYNMQGQLIKKEIFDNSPEYISLKGLKDGFYIARFFLGKDVFVTKINKIE